MNINIDPKNINFFKCFSSEKKLTILNLIAQKPRNIGELATELGVSSTIITRHINEFEQAGLITSKMTPGVRGMQKICSLAVNEALISFDQMAETIDSTVLNIPIGQFSDYSVEPTCGIASKDKYIGMVDDPRYFSNPERNNAAVLWFQSGFIEYTIPSYIFEKSDSITSITITLEICSEYPGYKDDFPSDIYFNMNDTDLGYWTSPGNFGDKKGTYTPSWFTCGTEYGLRKTLMINHEGSFIDGQKLSDQTISSLNLKSQNNVTLKLSSPKNTDHPGGITIFGRGFGNYDQDIIVTVNY